MSDYGYGLIGCGRVSQRHAEVIGRLEGARLAAIADMNTERAEQMATGHADSPRVYADYRDLLADDTVGVVVVLLPTHMHVEAVLTAADAGKHIYCEKAMATTLADCRRMIDATEAAGVKLAVGHNTRYFPPFAQAQRLLAAGEIGELVGMSGVFPNQAAVEGAVRPTFWGIKQGAQGHGVVVNFGCHYLDTTRAISGENPVRVAAHVGNRFSEHRAPEDQFAITAVCESGTFFTVSQFGQKKHVPTRNVGFTVYGTEGVIEAFYHPDHIAVRRADDDDYRQVEYDEDLQDGDPWMILHGRFLEAIRTGGEPPVTGMDGYRNLELALASYLSAESGRWMELPLGPEHEHYPGPTREESLDIAEP